ncbi:hypothetical protein Francci3_1849 [Frankia casuarinae]|uniref:Uncharacterized protein n=1 Tax=Frankia casuarinae (strain DSM 45818 / CECT 9043 / HFP020203 / CcI3) TaxID=106370 RepID=Q2JBW7_FRACC|nr:hypothetical protein Francci3_1849 [Frankia casuarinae]
MTSAYQRTVTATEAGPIRLFLAAAGTNVALVGDGDADRAQITLSAATATDTDRYLDTASVVDNGTEIRIGVALEPVPGNRGVRNYVGGGTVDGSIIQAGNIHGGITFNGGALRIETGANPSVEIAAVLPAGSTVQLRGQPASLRTTGRLTISQV